MSLHLLRLLPTVLLSRGMFLVSRIRRPRWLKNLFIRIFIRLYRIDTHEVEGEPLSYPCLGDFFVRRLKAGSRPVAGEPGAVVSPVDGRVVASGTVEEASVLTVKGTPYRLEELLACGSRLSGAFTGGPFMVFHLRPFDYHRIHMPCGGRVVGHAFVKGRLLPVHEKAVKGVGRLYVRNRRRITFFRGEAGLFALVKVGAFNVGRIPVRYETPETDGFTEVAEGRWFERGEEMGRFEMGSTVVLVFQPGVALFPRPEGSLVRVGEKIGAFAAERAGTEREAGHEKEKGDET